MLSSNQMTKNICIGSILLDAILKCPKDTHCELAQNIVLTGGIAMLPGFKVRLLKEIQKLLQTVQYADLKGLHQQFDVVESLYPSNCLSWLGGSVVGSLEVYYNNHRISREAYLKDPNATPSRETRSSSISQTFQAVIKKTT